MGDEDHLRRHSPLPAKLTSHTGIALQDIERRKHITTNTNNRLKHNLETLNHQQVSNLHSLRREERNLQNELKHLQQSSGHYSAEDVNPQKTSQSQDDSSYKGKKVKNRKSRKPDGENPVAPDVSVTHSGRQKSLDSQERKTATQLPPVVQSRSGPGMIAKKQVIGSDDSQNKKCTDFSDDEDMAVRQIKAEPSRSISETNIDSLMPFGDKSMSKSEQSLNLGWYTNIDIARLNITKRLSTSTGDVRGSSAKPSNSGPDLTPYLFAPPDGLPRTMYIMPSIDERMKQARLAKYVRKPGTKLDPIDKELQIDEVFDKSNPDEAKS